MSNNAPPSPLSTSAKLQAVHAAVRALSLHLVSDRYWSDEMAALQAAVLAGQIEPTEFLDASR